MKRYVVLFCCVVISAALWAQFDPAIGQYIYMPTAYNPAAAGDGDLMRAAGLHRMQFIGIKNAPMTTYFTFSSPFVIGKTKHAAGIRFLNDKFGLFSNQSFHVQYAYRQRLGKGYLSVGADLGFANISFDKDSVNLQQLSTSDYFDGSDPAIPSGGEATGMGFDMGLGVYYSAPTWWVGASYGHLTQTVIHWSDYSDISLRGTMYITGGYSWRLRSKNWRLEPSAMVMSDFSSWDAVVTMMCAYKDRYRWGVNYRLGTTVGILLGMDIISGLEIGYTYELPTSKLIYESFGSHEIYLAYGFDILKPRRTNRYKSVRYL